MTNGNTNIFRSLQINRKPLYEQIADKMQAMIAANQLKPGAQLPTERELAEQLNINRTTVHQALGLLQQRGIVEMKVGSGTYVINMPTSMVADSIQRYLVFGNCSAEDLIKFRELFEPGLAALAAERATDEDLHELSRLLQAGEDAFRRGALDAYAEADAAFHETLALSTHNELVIAISAGIHNLMRTWLSTGGQSHLLLDSPLSHRTVYESLLTRLPEQARMAMDAHLQLANAALLRQRKAQEGTGAVGSPTADSSKAGL
jgi:DNA-binding FadR family transcriptional regulator